MSGFFIMPGGEPSEEQIAMARAAEARRQLQLEEFQHGFQRLFEELDEEQLRHLSTMMHVVQHTPSTAIAWEGMIVHALKARFNICISCGVNHDQELPPIKAPEPVEKTDRPETVTPDSFDEQDRALMLQYHIDDLYEDETNRFLGFKCTGIKGMTQGCGYVYPSIADRILKGPEECPGCYQRMAHG